ncbi:hypothetical protein HNP00_002453 [Arthrobacter sp. AZCC_0090]|nr:hypothetical protein [Arthrobacter sp. AZCC_0090]
MTSRIPDTITLHIRERSEMDSSIEEAVQTLSAKAKTLKCGILVTRSGPQTFTACLSQEIPYGTTHERAIW